MEIKRIVPSGYCKGVVNAINIVKKTRQLYPDKNIYILGMIVHNSYVSKQMNELSVITLDDSNKSKEELLDEIKDGVVIFTAHGISDKIKQKANDKGLISVDASCVDVIKNKELIKEYLDKGFEVIYFGKRRHPEAEAILSLSDKIHLVCSISDIDNLNITNDKIFVTNQTTMSYMEVEDMIYCLKKKYPTCLIQKEICNATSSRQLAVTSIKDGDVLYVVGDVKSNNTNKLRELGEKNFKKSFLISSYKEINKKDLTNQNKIYVTAGASTPPNLVDEVIKYLSSL